MVVSPQSVFCLLHWFCFSLAPGSLPRVALFFCSLGLRSTSWETSVASVQRAWEDAETLWVSYELIGKLLTSLGTSVKISWLPGSLVWLQRLMPFLLLSSGGGLSPTDKPGERVRRSLGGKILMSLPLPHSPQRATGGEVLFQLEELSSTGPRLSSGPEKPASKPILSESWQSLGFPATLKGLHACQWRRGWWWLSNPMSHQLDNKDSRPPILDLWNQNLKAQPGICIYHLLRWVKSRIEYWNHWLKLMLSPKGTKNPF